MAVYVENPGTVRVTTPSGVNGGLLVHDIQYPYPYEHPLQSVEQLISDASGGLAARRAPRNLVNQVWFGNISGGWSAVNAEDNGIDNLVDNLVDGDFEGPSAGPWASDAAVFDADTLVITDGYPNRLQKRYVAGVFHADSEYSGLRLPGAIPVSAGQEYSLAGYVQADAPGRQVTAYIQWWDHLTTGSVVGTTPNASVTSGASAWTRVAIENQIAPVGAVAARLYLRTFGVAPGALTYYDSISFRAGPTAAEGPDVPTWAEPGGLGYFRMIAYGDNWFEEPLNNWWGGQGSQVELTEDLIGVPWNYSFYAKAPPGGGSYQVWPRVQATANGAYVAVYGSPVAVTADWARYSTTFTVPDSWPGAERYIFPQVLMRKADGTLPAPGTHAYFSNPQLTLGSTLHPPFQGALAS